MSEATSVEAAAFQVTPMMLLAKAIENKVDPDKLAKLMELTEHWQTNQAIEKYGQALASFQGECPRIEKTRVVMNKGGVTERYRFAAFEDVMAVVGPALARNGISISFTVPTTKELFNMTMRIQVGSYFIDKPYSAPMPDIANLSKATSTTEPQAFGIVLSYHKRYCLCAGLNIVVCDEDTDVVKVEVIDEDQLKQINGLLSQIEALVAKGAKPYDKTNFKKWLFGAWPKDGPEPEFSQLPQDKFDLTINELNRCVKSRSEK